MGKVFADEVGLGETCRAIFLHKGFLQLLRHNFDKLGRHAKKILTTDREKEAVAWLKMSSMPSIL